MDAAKVWKRRLTHSPQPAAPLVETGRGGWPTLRHGNIYFHSRYEPVEEARRQVDDARIDLSRPVIVIGLGLAYHVLELERRGARVLVIEPETAVARLALDTEFGDTQIPLHVGDLESLATDQTFNAVLKAQPQVYLHAPTARLHEQYVDEARQGIAIGSLRASRLNIAIVGPMYGGSLPVAEYLTRAFRKLGHRTLYVDNSEGHALFSASELSINSNNARNQLTGLLVNFLDQWSYARVTEFKADICIALSQAPLSTDTAQRLANDGIATAYWFAENWRHMGYWRQIAPHYDWIFHIQPGELDDHLREHGCRNGAFVQTGCDPEIHKPVALTKEEESIFDCDISFAGAGYANRKRILSGLTDYGLKIWGVEWQGRELKPFLQRPEQRFTPEMLTKIVAGSKINLNLHSSATHAGVDPLCDAVNPRVFEIAACGGFQLCDPCQNLDQFFDFET
ncbi:MAG: glycosyltransferase, partial [Candidatus Hydrogenedentes bacterium]|nr:glycosyltransferase [Candidatus Hydrogenedentota bacterium]